MKEANKRESKKCLEIALEAKKLKDWEKTERLYRKAAKLDFDINLAQLLSELEDAKNAEEEEIKAKLKAEEDRKRAEAIAKAKKLHEEETKKREERKEHGEAGEEIDRILQIVKNYDAVKMDRTVAFLVMKPGVQITTYRVAAPGILVNDQWSWKNSGRVPFEVLQENRHIAWVLAVFLFLEEFQMESLTPNAIPYDTRPTVIYLLAICTGQFGLVLLLGYLLG